MDGGLVKDGDMDARNQPALPPENRLTVFPANIKIA
jgi:hypothetical protein